MYTKPLTIHAVPLPSEGNSRHACLGRLGTRYYMHISIQCFTKSSRKFPMTLYPTHASRAGAQVDLKSL